MIAFLIIVVPAGIKWYLIVVLIYFFLMISEIEHLFMCLWPFICLLWKIRSSDHFLVRSFVFSLLSCMSSFVYTRYQLLIKYMICKFFSHSVCSLFVLWRFLSLCRSFLIWCCPTCLYLYFIFLLMLLCPIKKNHHQDPCQGAFFLCSGSFIILLLTCKSLIHFVNFWEWCKIGVQFHSFTCESIVSIEKTAFLH